MSGGGPPSVSLGQKFVEQSVSITLPLATTKRQSCATHASNAVPGPPIAVAIGRAQALSEAHRTSLTAEVTTQATASGRPQVPGLGRRDIAALQPVIGLA